MKKIIIATLLICLVVTSIMTPIYAIINTQYTMHNDYILAKNMDIMIDETIAFKDYDISMGDLSKELSTTKTGALSKQIYFENDADKQNNIMRVDVDFAGYTIPAPANVMFLMDQSGSMNMASSLKSYSHNATPCLNENHYYRIHIRISGKNYNYYLNTQKSGLTSSWNNQSADVLEHIQNAAIDANLATNASQVSVVSTYKNSYAPELNHFDVVDGAIIDSLFFEANQSNSFIQTDEESAVFSRIELGPLEVYGKTELYLSPYEWYNAPAVEDTDGTILTPAGPTTPDWKIVGSEAYFNYLNEHSLCYDRMMVSKVLFYELSNTLRVDNSENEVGFAKFAASVRESQDLSTDVFDEKVFMETDGYGWTNWSSAYSFASNQFSIAREGQDVVIMVTDGDPTRGVTTEGGINAIVDKLQTDHSAIAFFVGIGLSDTVMNDFADVASTESSDGSPQAFNGKSLEDFQEIARTLEEVLTSTTNLSSTMATGMEFTIDDTHPISVTFDYIDGDITSRETREYTTIEEANEIGITFENGVVTWDMHRVGITNVRLSYYQEVKISEEDIDKILEGESVEHVTDTSASVDFIDNTGAIAKIEDTTTTPYIVANASRLTIENTSLNPYDVETHELINHNITITNTGNLAMENVIVYQPIPENTLFVQNENATTQDSTHLSWVIPLIDPGETITFTYAFTITKPNVEIAMNASVAILDHLEMFTDGIPNLHASLLTHLAIEEELPPVVPPIDPPVAPEVEPEVPPVEPSDPQGAIEDDSHPQTGDVSKISMYIILAAGCLVGGTIIMLRKKK